VCQYMHDIGKRCKISHKWLTYKLETKVDWKLLYLIMVCDGELMFKRNH